MRHRQEDCRCGQCLKNYHDDVPIFYEQHIQELTLKYLASKAIKKIVFGILDNPNYNFRGDISIDENSSFEVDCNFDSLDCLEFLLEIEEKFGISITEEEAKELKTIGDLITHIASKKNFI